MSPYRWTWRRHLPADTIDTASVRTVRPLSICTGRLLSLMRRVNASSGRHSTRRAGVRGDSSGTCFASLSATSARRLPCRSLSRGARSSEMVRQSPLLSGSLIGLSAALTTFRRPFTECRHLIGGSDDESDRELPAAGQIIEIDERVFQAPWNRSRHVVISRAGALAGMGPAGLLARENHRWQRRADGFHLASSSRLWSAGSASFRRMTVG